MRQRAREAEVGALGAGGGKAGQQRPPAAPRTTAALPALFLCGAGAHRAREYLIASRSGPPREPG